MDIELPYWRSLLFVPANRDRFIDGAVKRGADAYVLDLEDSVPAAEKSSARDGLQDAVGRLSSSGVDVLVRINRPWRLAIRDIEASVAHGVTALALPKVPDPAYVCAVAEILEELEVERGLESGHTRLIVMIETPGGHDAGSGRLCAGNGYAARAGRAVYACTSDHAGGARCQNTALGVRWVHCGVS